MSRLANLGVDRDTIRDNLRFSAAQRLLPKLCPACKLPASSETVAAAFALAGRVVPDESARYLVLNPRGCSLCKGGIIGRVPAIEYLVNNAGFDEDEPKVSVSLQDAALLLAAEGHIDLREGVSIA